MRGRKPAPASLKLARIDDKPRPELAIPEPPATLRGDALDEWHRITALLIEVGLLAHLDRAAVSIYCQAWARWIKAEAEVASGGEVVKAPSGYPIQNPWLAIANAAAKQIDSKLAEFGLSPSARGRLFAAPKRKDEPRNEWEGLLANG